MGSAIVEIIPTRSTVGLGPDSGSVRQAASNSDRLKIGSEGQVVVANLAPV